MSKTIDDLIVELSNTPFDPVLSFDIAVQYESIGQTASAVSFYLRTAEYGYYSHPNYVYASLLKSAQCFESQKGRKNTVLNLFLKAIAFLPSRPEAWFLLARYYERDQKWQEAYTTAEVGLSLAQHKQNPLPIWVDYAGEYVLRFERAVAGWWVGRKDEAITEFKQLLKEDINNVYATAIKNNLNTIDDTPEWINPLEPVVTNYRKFFGSKAPVILDVGTRDGDDAYYLYKELNGSKVVAIDANPVCVRITNQKYPWMTLFHCAVSEINGETTFNQVTSDNIEILGTSSVFSKDTSINPPADFYKDKIKEITVPTMRMDALLEKAKIEGTIDVVKVDTEGYSWQVLQSFGERLKDVKVFHLETERTQSNPEHRLTEDITAFMSAQGFVLVDVSHEWGWNVVDQVWVNPNLATRNKDCF